MEGGEVVIQSFFSRPSLFLITHRGHWRCCSVLLDTDVTHGVSAGLTVSVCVHLSSSLFSSPSSPRAFLHWRHLFPTRAPLSLPPSLPPLFPPFRRSPTLAAPRSKSLWMPRPWPASVSNVIMSLRRNSKRAGGKGGRPQEQEGGREGEREGIVSFFATSPCHLTIHLSLFPPLSPTQTLLAAEFRKPKRFPPTSSAPRLSPSCTPCLLLPPLSWPSLMPPQIGCLSPSTPPMESTSRPQARWSGTCSSTRYVLSSLPPSLPPLKQAPSCSSSTNTTPLPPSLFSSLPFQTLNILLFADLLAHDDRESYFEAIIHGLMVENGPSNFAYFVKVRSLPPSLPGSLLFLSLSVIPLPKPDRKTRLSHSLIIFTLSPSLKLHLPSLLPPFSSSSIVVEISNYTFSKHASFRYVPPTLPPFPPPCLPPSVCVPS